MARGGRWGASPGGRRLFLGFTDRDFAAARALGGRMSGGQDIHPLFFAPGILSVTPNMGSTLGGTNVTISGSNFRPGVIVLFGSKVPATNIVVNGPTSISCTTIAHPAGAVTVTVTNPDGQSASLVNGYTYVNPLLVAVGTNVVAGSIDAGATWTLGTIPAGTWNDVIWAGDRFVAITANGHSAYSVDGATWTAGGLLTRTSGYQALLSNPTGSILVAMNVNATGLFCSSFDKGLTWGNQFNSTGDGGANALGWAFNQGYFMTGNGYRTTTDGINYSAFHSVVGLGNGTVRCGFSSQSGLIVTIGTFASAPASRYSTDGVTFGGALLPQGLSLNVSTNGVVFSTVAVGSQAGNTSPDGITWTGDSPVPPALMAEMIFNGSIFIGRNARNIYQSTDGATWTTLTNALPAGTWNALCQGGRNRWAL